MSIMWRYIRTYPKLSLLLGSLFALWIGAEIADPLPNSGLWRYISTHHRVHVVIEAEVDGEQVTLERTFRCYKIYSLNFDPMSPGFVQMRVRQAGAAIGAQLKDGRYLHVVFPAMCSYAGDHSGEGYEQVGIPIFRVADRLADPSRVEMHVDPDAVLTGRTGVKLLSIKVENPAPPEAPPVQDWAEADNLALSGQFIGQWFSADYALVHPRAWWSQYPEVASVMEKVTQPQPVNYNLPGALSVERWAGYPDDSGWLTARDQSWVSFGVTSRSFKPIAPRLAGAHSLRVRDGHRVIDMDTAGVLEFTPDRGPHSTGIYKQHMPLLIGNQEMPKGSYGGVVEIYVPSLSSIISFESSDLRPNTRGQ